MTNHFNQLTPAEVERLVYLIEEMTEAQKAACKILRHGYYSFNPHDPDSLGNRDDLVKELMDVTGAIARMYEANDLPINPLENANPLKGQQYMHHQ